MLGGERGFEAGAAGSDIPREQAGDTAPSTGVSGRCRVGVYVFKVV